MFVATCSPGPGDLCRSEMLRLVLLYWSGRCHNCSCSGSCNRGRVFAETVAAAAAAAATEAVKGLALTSSRNGGFTNSLNIVHQTVGFPYKQGPQVPRISATSRNAPLKCSSPSPSPKSYTLTGHVQGNARAEFHTYGFDTWPVSAFLLQAATTTCVNLS